MSSPLASAAVAVSTVLALAIFLVSVASYRRVRRPRFLVLAAAFGLFAAKGVALSVGLFTTDDLATLFAVGSAFDAAVLVALYAAVVKR